MEQLELFNDSNQFLSNTSRYLGSCDWELESDRKLFSNTPKASNDGSLDDNSKLFSNKNNLSELAVREYHPGGTAGKGNKYYCFSYRDGKKTKHIHIKGGNTTNPIAIKRKNLVIAWIKEDVPLEKIIKWIKEW